MGKPGLMILQERQGVFHNGLSISIGARVNLGLHYLLKLRFQFAFHAGRLRQGPR